MNHTYMAHDVRSRDVQRVQGGKVPTTLAAHTLQNCATLLNLAALDEGVGGLGQQQATKEQDDGGNAGQGQGNAPAVAA